MVGGFRLPENISIAVGCVPRTLHKFCSVPKGSLKTPSIKKGMPLYKRTHLLLWLNQLFITR
ncbi:Uncharacterised protein [Alysiella crassa]|uniref:Uncharacterized protein n=1 Tax=Alysiella crassa TaxID=153491 RepID=A0A376BN48_9NEIS|nr:Uncharacterised protein [Alysiella crassa]